MCVCVCVCMCACMRACVRACVFACKTVCMCMYNAALIKDLWPVYDMEKVSLSIL